MKCGPEALERAAEEAEKNGEYRRAFGFWKELLAEYGVGSYNVTESRVQNWKWHLDVNFLK